MAAQSPQEPNLSKQEGSCIVCDKQTPSAVVLTALHLYNLVVAKQISSARANELKSMIGKWVFICPEHRRFI